MTKLWLVISSDTLTISTFSITDHSKRGDIAITHCPTPDMLSDFYTKATSGFSFQKFHAVLIDHEEHLYVMLP
jgi:hypothetical protein